MKTPDLPRVIALLLAVAMLCVYSGSSPALAGDELPEDTDQLRSLTPEQACQAIASNRDVLSLNGITSLSVEAAHQLKEFQGKCMHLDGLETLSPEVANELTWYVGFMTMDGLREVSDETVWELGATGGERTWLPLPVGPDADEIWSAAIASANARRGLSLNGLESLSEVAVYALAGSRYNALSLNGVENIHPKHLAVLAQFKGHVLSLGGLKTLDTQGAKALSGFAGELFLNGLSTLDASTAKALAEFQGESVYLQGLQSLPPEAAELLRRHPGIRLPSKLPPADSE